MFHGPARHFLLFCLLSCFGAERFVAAQAPSAKDWPQYNYDNLAWRFNEAEKALSPSTVPKLVEKWRFPPRGSKQKLGAFHATPVVVNGFVYASSARQGVLYKLSPAGKLVWKFEVPQQKIKYQAEPTEEMPEDYRFNFPVAPNGAVYSFGLPGEDEVDGLPEDEAK